VKVTTRIVYTVVAVGLIIVLFYILGNNEANSEGSITIRLYDQTDVQIIDESHLFYEGDTLFKVLDKHYDLTCANSHYNPESECDTVFSGGHVLLGIEDISTDWNTTFLYLEVDSVRATSGVDGVRLKDNSIYAFYVRTPNE
jgi:hypothetical protein